LSGETQREQMQIHCQQCGVRLTVPLTATGHAARCPACHACFQVPKPRDIFDETVVCWLDLDSIADARHRRDLEGEAEADDVPVARAAPEPPRPVDEAQAESPPDDQTRHAVEDEVEDKVEEEDESQGNIDALVGELIEAATVDGEFEPTQSEEHVADAEADATPGASAPVGRAAGNGNHAADAPPAESPAPASAAPPVRSRAPTRSPPRSRSANPGGTPRLEVLQVGAFGVRLGFPARALDHARFRASMPMRGIISNERDPAKLCARPLAWLDKATGHLTDPGALEARYEVHLRPHSRPLDVIEMMSVMDELAPPFNQPMPYYVARGDIGQASSLHCQTVPAPDGVRCEVAIPSMAYALDWLGRVNGVCGDDYADLEAQAGHYESGAWLSIPIAVRHRLAAWFDFEGDEQFLDYFNDADFPDTDAGLAGLVVTSRRIVWSKYHRHGAKSMHPALEVRLVPDGPFVNIECGRDGAYRPILRVRPAASAKLAPLLRDAGWSVREEDAPAD